MADFTDYGVTVGISYSGSSGTFYNVGSLYKIDPPSIIQGEIENTNHGSGGKRSYIPAKLFEISEMKLTVGYNKDTTSASIISAVKSGSMLDWKVTFPNAEIWQFQGFTKIFAPLSSDSQKPDKNQSEITIRPTGDLTLS